MIIFLDGPINAGKSTVGTLLARRLPYTVHIEVDQLRHFAAGLALEQAIPFALGDVAGLTNAWIERGFQVVVSWSVTRADRQRFAAATAATGAPLFPFTLLPALAIALSDRGERRLSDSERARIREMYAGMYGGARYGVAKYDDGQPAGVVIDNSHQTPAETVETILKIIEPWPAAADPEPATVLAGAATIAMTDQPSPADVAFIRQRIREFNDSVSEYHRLGRRSGKEALTALLHAPSGELIGGLLATTYWGWLDIDELWLAEPIRGQGHGRTLMGLVERAAMKRGCRQAQVKSWDFQARGFYERLGYHVVGRQSAYPPGQTLYWLRKELPGNAP